jgi:hypothetical protein
MTAFTAGSAFVNHDDEAGTLRAGSRADLVMLGAKLESARSLADVPIELTVAAGRIVHRS